jgi:hypothetical protein
MHFRVERVLQKAIVRSLDDSQAEILWMAQRIEPRALRHGCGFEAEETFDRPIGAQHGEIIDHIKSQYRGLCDLAGWRADVDPVAIRRMNQLRDHVIIGDNLAPLVGEKPAADRRFGA